MEALSYTLGKSLTAAGPNSPLISRHYYETKYEKLINSNMIRKENVSIILLFCCCQKKKKLIRNELNPSEALIYHCIGKTKTEEIKIQIRERMHFDNLLFRVQQGLKKSHRK